MALFGLSPLFLSVIASDFFTDPVSGTLNIILFLKFLAVLTASAHVLGYFVLHTPSVSYTTSSIANHVDRGNIDEDSALLPRITRSQRGEPPSHPIVDSLHPTQDWSFWLLWLYCLLVIGAVSAVWTCRYGFGNLYHRLKW
jgi:hypothetical protein